MFDLTCYGDPCTDFVYNVENKQVSGGKILGHFIGEFSGGTTANVACAASRLGTNSTIVGRIPSGPSGQKLRDDLDLFGVDLTNLRTVKDLRGTHTIISIDASGEKSLIYCPLDKTFVNSNQVKSTLSQTKAAYIMAADFSAVRPFIDADSIFVCVDVDAAAGLTNKQFKNVSEQANMLFINEIGYKKLFNSQPDNTSAIKLLSHRIQSVVITGGGGITYAASKNNFGKILTAQANAFPTIVQDSTGAGDTFNAAFLVSFNNGLSLRSCLKNAMAAGAMAVSKIGARGYMPSFNQISQYLENNKND